MKTRAILGVAAAALLAAAVPTSAQKPKPPGQQAVTLKSSANPITFSHPLTLSGSVKGAKSGVAVKLQRRALTGTTWKEVASATTDQAGDVRFVVRPRRSVAYRAATTATPPDYSPELIQQVAPLIGFVVSDLTPKADQRVRFRGTVRPAHDGRRVQIQRKQADGTWAVVARPRLRDAGRVYSKYGRRLRITQSGTYRVVLPAHADHAEGVSRERTLTVG